MERHALSSALCLAALLAILATAGCGGGGSTEPGPEAEQPLRLAEVVPGSGLRVSQVDFEDDQNPLRDTTWGRVLVDPDELAKATGIEKGWLNIATANGWAVVNLPMPPAGEPPFAVYFDLGLEQTGNIKQTNLCVRYSNRALETIEEEFGRPASFPVSDWVIDHRGFGPHEEIDTILPPPALSVLERVFVPLESNGWYQMATNEQCAKDQCLTMATANALQYLENMHVLTVPHDHGPGLRGDTTLVGMLDEYASRPATSRTVGDGIQLQNIVDGAFEYFSDESMTGDLGHRHQDSGWASTLPASDYSAFGSTSYYDGSTPVFDWIYERLGEGCGVVAGYQHAGGGHAVRITAAFEDDAGRQWIRYAHDALQTHRDLTDTRGLENVVVEFVDLDGDGLPNFGAVSSELRLVWAHCP